MSSTWTAGEKVFIDAVLGESEVELIGDGQGGGSVVVKRAAKEMTMAQGRRIASTCSVPVRVPL
jgi:hypothetical protein